MRKILIAIAAMITAAAGLVSTPSPSDARGFRFGVGFGISLRSLIYRRVRPRIVILRNMERARGRARAAAIRAEQAAEARAEARTEAARARQRKALQANAAPKPTPHVQEDELLHKAQLEQQAKAEELVRQLSEYKPTSTTQRTTPKAAQAVEPNGRVAAPASPQRPQAESAPNATLRPALCKRFLPGADAIVSVPCAK